jgi:large subunit ribosomal protein L24
MNLRKGDTVRVMRGKDRGKEGPIARVFPTRNRVTVQGVNMYAKHVRAKNQGETGQKVDVPRAVALANVMAVCPSCKKPTRIGHRMEGDKKVRVCKHCNASF